MYTILDYIDWRGDLSFESSPLCEVDSVILSRLSYIPFDNIVPKSFDTKVTLKEAADKFLALPDATRRVYMDEDINLILKMAQSKRFKDLNLCGFINEFDAETEKQFCALTINLSDNYHFVSFRGTDNTLVGWKEDFNMSFMSPVPSQEAAVIYLETAMESLKGNFVVAGHSKGGNLAIYSSAFCHESMQPRIISAYNFDGPGFDKKIIDTDGYQHIVGRSITFVPQSSIVGMLLEHEEEYITIKSAERLGPMQHDIFSWLLMRTEFIRLDTITESSKFIDTALKDAMKALTPSQRESFIDSIYSLFASTGAERLRDMRENPLDTARAVFSSFRDMDKEAKEMIGTTMLMFLKSAKDTINRMNEK